MTLTKLLNILQEETNGFKEQSRLRDDVLNAMEQAYIKGKKEQLTLTDVVSTFICDTCKDKGSIAYWHKTGMGVKPCEDCKAN